MTVSITKPTVGASVGSWGTQINTALDAIVTEVNAQSGTFAPVRAAADVVAPAATGVAASDTANLQAAIGATPAGGRLYIPAGTYLLNAALSITSNITVEGNAAVAVFPSNNDGTLPTTVSGTVLKQTVAATDAVQITGSALSVHLRNLAVLFTTGLASTGHGINASPTATIASGHTIGLNDFRWDNIHVFGHDGNHYAAVFLNPLLGTVSHFRSYGGGGISVACDAGAINAGNIVFLHPYVELNASGSAAGYAHSGAVSSGAPGVLNLLTYVRPQCIAGGAAKTAGTQYLWNDLAGAATPQYINVIGADLESTSNPVKFGAGTQLIGNALISGSTYPSNNSVVAAGPGALPNPSAGANSAFGAFALGVVASTGTNNTAVGYSALTANTSGGSNTVLGSQAQSAASTASNNTGVGASALKNGNSSNQTAFGFQALLAGGSTQDVAIGYTAGNGLDGSGLGKNTMIGATSGVTGTPANKTVGSNGVTFVGYGSGQSSASNLAQGTAIGFNALIAGNYSAAYGASASATASGAVAIGTDSGGAGASTSVANTIALGTANHKVQLKNNTTGAGSAALGANCPATTATAPYTWFAMLSSDGSTVYVPAWK